MDGIVVISTDEEIYDDEFGLDIEDVVEADTAIILSKVVAVIAPRVLLSTMHDSDLYGKAREMYEHLVSKDGHMLKNWAVSLTIETSSGKLTEQTYRYYTEERARTAYETIMEAIAKKA